LFHNQVRTICMCDSSSCNSLSLGMLKSLVTEIKRDEDNKNLRSIVLMSEPGKVFSAGHNLKELVCSYGLTSIRALLHTHRTEKSIIGSHHLDGYEHQISQGRVWDLLGVNAGHQSESGANNCSGGRFGSRSRLSIGCSVWYRGVHGKKFVLHSRVLSQNFTFHDLVSHNYY